MMTARRLPILLPLMLAAAFLGALPARAADEAALAAHQPEPYVKLTHPEWAKKAVIYQINTRQFTPEGTFTAAAKQLPRLKAMGVDILWLMPVQEIGVQNRKGTLGSPYSIKDYYKVNPEFGTMEELKAFLAEAHALGLHVILDWVANHTAWDNALAADHPDWYERDWKGDFRPTPWWDWEDIIDLDYSKPEVRAYMADAMKFWVQDVGFDGFRCDVAGYVPLDFWEKVRVELDAVKPVFMLAEWQSRDLMAKAFDATYSWEWFDSMKGVAQGKADVGALFGYYSNNESGWPEDGYRMTYTSNHDKNAWEGTDAELFGKGFEAATVLAIVGEGMPMIYNGQEAGLDKRLEFFERDPIDWPAKLPLEGFYTRLFKMVDENEALWNGAAGARMVRVVNDRPSEVFSFVRQKGKAKLFAVFNMTDKPVTVGFKEPMFVGDYAETLASGRAPEVSTPATLSADTRFELAPWGYRVFSDPAGK
ncbi:alpha-amylase family glycosyl hydrolase [Gimibacter soli]|uniref:Alpha-amylase family glycosyl hydrolase n=1 Tax=Gimibacter soli TaxID=3024400 RepID=A0AAE9XRQ7_9PROT|nr:alpha-amylase family glycosyl hydrolase [Gimibacter soli]WCL54844.1 alpha-amylase family glycosyl hydrolase [Gimibacter soli]